MRERPKQESSGETDSASWQVIKAPPHVSLAPYINEYQGYAGRSSAPLRRRELPMPGVPLIINFGAPFAMVDPETGRRVGKHGSFVAGLHNRFVLVDSTGTDLCLQVNLTPIGAHRFLRASMGNLTDQTIELADLLGPRAGGLIDCLASAPTWDRRFDLLDTIFAERIYDAREASPEVVWAWQQLTATHGQIRIGELTRETGWSRKRLAARFREQIGIPPKALGRVMRFQRALELLSPESTAPAIEVAYACGYADQAHMINEFQALGGATPRELMRMGAEPAVGIVEP